MFSYSSVFPSFPSILPFVPNKKHSSVAITIDPTEHLLMIQRASREGDPWSGHMAFPGGKYESQDGSLLETARRECKEEVGFDPKEHGKSLGALERIHHPRICVDAIVYLLNRRPNIIPNEEVADVFWIPIQELQDKDFHATYDYRVGEKSIEMPAIVLPQIPVPIWGFSLRFIHDLLSRGAS